MESKFLNAEKMESKLLNSKKKEFEIFDAALASLLFIIYNFLFIQLYSLVPASIRANDLVYYLASFLVEFVFALVAITVAKARKVDMIEATGAKKKVSGRLVWLCFLVSVVCLFLFSQLTGVFLDFLSLCGYKSVLGDLEINTFWQYLVYAIVSCVVPAVCEELLFRGVILSGLKKYGTYLAIVISSLIFTFMHGNPEQTVHQFIIGFVVGYFFVKTGNLWIGVIVHFFNNFISVTQAYIYSFIDMGTETVAASGGSINPWLSLAIDLLIAVILAYFGYWFIRNLKTKILDEDARINGGVVLAEETNTTIAVDGKSQDATLMVDGKPLKEETDAENETADVKVQDKKPLSLSTIILFSLSAIYLVFDWIYVLLYGLGVF